MRVGNVFVLGSSIVALLAAIACNESSQRIVEEPDENEPGASTNTSQKSDSPTKGKTDDTCLGKASLAFDDTDCNTCMSDDAACCQATITCFKDDPDCAALHTCIQGCGGGGGGGGSDGGTGNALTIWNNEVYPKVNATCGSCHRAGTGGAAIFFGADAAATYTLFKQRKYHLANSAFVTKGLHNGPALTADERASVDKWVAAEAGGGGGGGGNGTGGGGGNGDGGGNGAACKEACKAQHPNALTKWQAYNTCAVVTCKAACL